MYISSRTKSHFLSQGNNTSTITSSIFDSFLKHGPHALSGSMFSLFGTKRGIEPLNPSVV